MKSADFTILLFALIIVIYISVETAASSNEAQLIPTATLTEQAVLTETAVPTQTAMPTKPATPTNTPTPTQTATPQPTVAPPCVLTKANLTAHDEGLNDGHGPELAVDGEYADVESRWSADGDGRWLQLDIGGIGALSELATAWYKADERTAIFDIEISVDGIEWMTVLTNVESQGDTEFHAVNFDNVTARYVRIIGHGNSSNMWNSLLEIEIWTCGAVVLGAPGEVPPTVTPAPPPTPAPTPITSGNAIPETITAGRLLDIEGLNPHPLVDAQTLVFVPLEAQHTTPNGNGWRHEYKIKRALRVALADTYEEFEATIKVELSDGGKTIVTQYHAGGLGTIMKVYVSDSGEKGFFDSQPANGVFDVYVRIRNAAGIEEKFALGMIKSGDRFSLRVVNNYGLMRVEAFGVVVEKQVLDDSASYLKFGNYLQSQNPVGSVNCGERGNSGSFADCYEALGITEAKVTMTDVSYTRETR